MGILIDFLVVIGYCVARLQQSPTQFLATLAGGLLLAGLMWVACVQYVKLWNLRYRAKPFHHVVCAAVAGMTLLFTLAFSGLQYTQEIAGRMVDAWQVGIKADAPWAERTFNRAYDAVEALHVEDFSRCPRPVAPAQDSWGSWLRAALGVGSCIPTVQGVSRKKAAEIYAEGAVDHFDETHPYLSKVIWAEPGVPGTRIDQDLHYWFDELKKNPYPPERAIDLAAGLIRQGLVEQLPRVVALSRIGLFIAFLLLQSIAFGLVGYAAYRDLKTYV